MAYYHSPKQYEMATGKRFTTKCSCIHRTGSVKGMVKQGFWDKDSELDISAIVNKTDIL